MYKRLSERYAAQSPTSRVQLQTKLHRMSYDSSMTMSAYLDSMESIFPKLEAMDNKAEPESLQVAMQLASFGNVNESPYGPVVSA